MSVKYSWSRQNGAAVPPVRFMSIEAEDYYKGMPLKLKEKGVVEPTDGDPEYICMAHYDPDAEIQPLEIPVQEVFPDVVYEKMNEDGSIEEVRFGSKGGGGGVQPDMYQTDPEALDFVKNNPIESGVVELAFDGTLEGKEYKTVYAEGIVAYMVKMSDDIPAIDDLIYYHVAAPQKDYIGEVTEDVIDDGSVTGISGYTVDRSILVVTNPCEVQGVLLSTGIWFSAMDASILGGTGWIGGLGLTYNGKQLKPSLLPAHSHKWDDIEDAICWDKSTSAPLNITWDGDITGKEIVAVDEGQNYIKISDIVLTSEQIIGSNLTLLYNGEEEYNKTFTESDLTDGTTQGVPAIVVDGQVLLIVSGDVSGAFGGLYFSTGVWLLFAGEIGGNASMVLSNPNVTITTSEIKKIDGKYMPDGYPHKETTNAPLNISFNNDPTGYETVDIGGMFMAKVSDAVLSIDEIDGTLVTTSIDGEYSTEVLSREDINDMSSEGIPIMTFGGGLIAFVYGDATSSKFGLSEGIWVVVSEGSMYIAAISNPNVMVKTTKMKPFDPDFMPELSRVILKSTTEGSIKKFRVTVDDSGTLKATEV